MTKIFLSLGSNIEPVANLRSAVQLLTGLGQVVAVSSVWQSAAVGYEDQPDFLNAAVMMLGDLTPAMVYRDWIQLIENKLERRRDPLNKNAPRTIDVDLSLYGDATLEVLGRAIPDEDILTRPFVAVPLAEVDGEFTHPQFGRSLRDIAHGFEAAKLTRRTDISLDEGGPSSM